MTLSPAVYELFESTTPFLILWLTVFVAATTGKLVARALGRDFRRLDGLIGSELPGLPHTLMHTVCFCYAISLGDWWSVALFAWWGPGFVIVASWYLYIHALERPFDWSPYAWPTSIACKVIYLVLMAAFFAHGLQTVPFVFSVWIMHDQVRLAWFHGNADRSRRVTEDYWVFRVLYFALLWVPWWDADTPWRPLAMALGPWITVLWIGGLVQVIRAGRFRRIPDDPNVNLRDIVYLRRRVRHGDTIR